MPLVGVTLQMIVMTELRGRKLQHLVWEAGGNEGLGVNMLRGFFTGGKLVYYNLSIHKGVFTPLVRNQIYKIRECDFEVWEACGFFHKDTPKHLRSPSRCF